MLKIDWLLMDENNPASPVKLNQVRSSRENELDHVQFFLTLFLKQNPFQSGF